jgi:phosphodiesterase/alkaline phosphatase D-like protein
VLGRSSTSGFVSVQVDNGPVISGISFTPGLTPSSARVTWRTDALADGQVEFGPTLAYGASTPIDTRADWRHDMQLTGLLPATQYHYRVRSRDANAALAVSADQVFFTP